MNNKRDRTPLHQLLARKEDDPVIEAQARAASSSLRNAAEGHLPVERGNSVFQLTSDLC